MPSALRSVVKVIRGETDLERHRRRMRIDGSVTLRILGPVLTVTLFATFVATMVQVYGHNWKLTNNVVPMLSVVVGLILVFRNGDLEHPMIATTRGAKIMARLCPTYATSHVSSG
ncbi:Bestrophin protein [Ceratobasidium theobromae]|uniref:Bestrophin protein n=1 Tax=Ceratobasidium theobromae TaxID=1582974 RepID=A0A5N5QG56_9AGAM|nr:Bestrophin protein [Ceratobasidium theobromae]